MNSVRCVGIIPAQASAVPGQGLNALVMAINDAPCPQTCCIRIYGSTGGTWRSLAEKECTLASSDHAHLYFHIPARCFTGAFWDGEAPEELSLWPGIEEPAPGTPGVLVFCNE